MVSSFLKYIPGQAVHYRRRGLELNTDGYMPVLLLVSSFPASEKGHCSWEEEEEEEEEKMKVSKNYDVKTFVKRG